MNIFKNIRKASIGLALLGLVQVSCKKTFLDEYNPANRTTDNFYSDSTGYESLVNSCYPLLRNITQSRQLTLKGTDIFTSNGWGGIYYSIPNQLGSELDQYDIRFNSLQSDLNGLWSDLYKEVNRCNAVISRADAIPSVYSKKAFRLGEAKFLRALSYFWLVQQWGDIPMPITESLTGSLEAPKTLAKDVYAQIIADLTSSIILLPAKQTDDGRATKGAANFLLAKVYLTRGWNFNNSLGGSAADFTSSLKLCDELINSNLYPLESKWTNLFPDHPKKVTGTLPSIAAAVSVANASKEVVFAVQYANATAYFGDANIGPVTGLIGNNMHSQFYPGPSVISQIATNGLYSKYQGGGFTPTWAAYRLFDSKLDSRYEGTFNGVCYATMASTLKLSASNNNRLTTHPAIIVYAVGDTTAVATPWDYPVTDVTKLGVNVPGGTKKYAVTNNSEMVGFLPTIEVKDNMIWAAPMFWKFHHSGVPVQDGFSTYNDPLFRSAELYLMAAEAIVKGATGATSGSADVYYNKVLDRALGTNTGQSPNRALNPEKGTDLVANKISYRATPANISIDMILDESAREFMGESQRWNDLKRTQTIETRAAKYNPWVGYGLNGVKQFKANHYLRPIPQYMIDVTLPKIGQNLGY